MPALLSALPPAAQPAGSPPAPVLATKGSAGVFAAALAGLEAGPPVGSAGGLAADGAVSGQGGAQPEGAHSEGACPQGARSQGARSQGARFQKNDDDGAATAPSQTPDPLVLAVAASATFPVPVAALAAPGGGAAPKVGVVASADGESAAALAGAPSGSSAIASACGNPAVIGGVGPGSTSVIAAALRPVAGPSRAAPEAGLRVVDVPDAGSDGLHDGLRDGPREACLTSTLPGGPTVAAAAALNAAKDATSTALRPAGLLRPGPLDRPVVAQAAPGASHGDVTPSAAEPRSVPALPPVPVAPVPVAPATVPPSATMPPSSAPFMLHAVEGSAVVLGAPAPAPARTPFAAQLAKPLFTLAAAAPGEHVMTVKVTPDNLGPVTVQAHIGADGVKVELFAPTDAGRAAVQAVLPELRRDLADAGIGASLDLSSRNSPQDAGAGAGGMGAGGGFGRDGGQRDAGDRANPGLSLGSLRGARASPSLLSGTDTSLDILA